VRMLLLCFRFPNEIKLKNLFLRSCFFKQILKYIFKKILIIPPCGGESKEAPKRIVYLKIP
jgi:hypothetical protein